jgi:glycosyltransferase involved in cell wall biosynthesis
MYKIAIVGGPAAPYVRKCLDSVLNQDHTDFEACIVVDPAGDRTINTVWSYIKNRPDSRMKLIVNNKQQYALPNLIKAFDAMRPTDDDRLITVDLDDWFTGNNSLSIVDNYYRRYPHILMTYGSWLPYPNISAQTNNAPYNPEEFANLRNVNWRASHLRTFSYKLWRRLKDCDLRDAKGVYFKSAWDLAMIFPMLEMAGYERTKYISERVYTYNQETPFNDSKLRLREQMYYTQYIAKLKPYDKIEDL